MAKSRVRKQPKPKNKKVKKEVFAKGGMEIIRKGRNIFIRNKMTEEEHAQYIEQIKENYPKIYEQIKELIEEAVNKINSFDKIFILGGIASYSYMKILSDNSDDSFSETVIEYCQSIAMATPNINKGKLPTGEVLHQIREILIKIRKYFDEYYGYENIVGKHSKIQAELRYRMISDALHVRGEGYIKHIRSLFIEMFSNHDDFFEKHYGFKVQHLLETFSKLEEAYGCMLIMPDGLPHPIQRLKLTKWVGENREKLTRKMIETGEYLDKFSKEHPEVLVRDNHVVLYSLNVINTYDELYKIRPFNKIQSKVVKALSLKFGDNTIFSEPEKIKYEILNKSKIYSYPIVEDDDGEMYLFSMSITHRNYFLIAQNLIQTADPQYYKNSFLGNRIKIAKDEFIEQKVLSLFKTMLPKVNFYKGAYYKFLKPSVDLKCAKAPDGRYELDILGVSENATYLVEVKAGLVSPEAKRGAIKSIKTDLSNIIGDAICQGYRAALYINESDNPCFEDVNGEIIIPKNTNNVFRISISFSYAGDIIASLSKLQEFEVIDKNAGFAWTVNIFDLIPFAELMNSEEMFIDYLNKRLPMYSDKRLVDTDEMDMLGLYFENDLKIDKAFKGLDTVQLNQYKSDIDDYYQKKGKMPVKK